MTTRLKSGFEDNVILSTIKEKRGTVAAIAMLTIALSGCGKESNKTLTYERSKSPLEIQEEAEKKWTARCFEKGCKTIQRIPNK